MIVQPPDVGVVDPVPRQPGARPTQSLITLTGVFGTLIDKTVRLPQILPGQSIDFSQRGKHLPPFEIGTVRLEINDDSVSPAVTSTAAASLTLIPGPTILVLVLIAMAAITGYAIWNRRKIPPPVRRDSLKAAAR